jgi:hypothetical protein
MGGLHVVSTEALCKLCSAGNSNGNGASGTTSATTTTATAAAASAMTDAAAQELEAANRVAADAAAAASGCHGVQFVFVSACFSLRAGQAFADAGVPHVICVNVDAALLDNAALAFTRAVYLSLAVGDTVQMAYDIGLQAVAAAPNIPNSQVEVEKFLLLPPTADHHVPIFPAAGAAQPMAQPMQPPQGGMGMGGMGGMGMGGMGMGMGGMGMGMGMGMGGMGGGGGGSSSGGGCNIQLKFEYATTERLRNVVTLGCQVQYTTHTLFSYSVYSPPCTHYPVLMYCTPTYPPSVTLGCQALHYSGHGNPDCLSFEDGMGGLHVVSTEALCKLCSAGNSNGNGASSGTASATTTTATAAAASAMTDAAAQELEAANRVAADAAAAASGCHGVQFVFVSACFSLRAGQAFADAGVPHVICVNVDAALLDNAALAFTRAVYLSLAVGDTVQMAYDIGLQAVAAAPNIPNSQVEVEKFLLLPPTTDHHVPIFPAAGAAQPMQPMQPPQGGMGMGGMGMGGMGMGGMGMGMGGMGMSMGGMGGMGGMGSMNSGSNAAAAAGGGGGGGRGMVAADAGGGGDGMMGGGMGGGIMGGGFMPQMQQQMQQLQMQQQQQMQQLQASFGQQGGQQGQQQQQQQQQMQQLQQQQMQQQMQLQQQYQQQAYYQQMQMQQQHMQRQQYMQQQQQQQQQLQQYRHQLPAGENDYYRHQLPAGEKDYLLCTSDFITMHT